MKATESRHVEPGVVAALAIQCKDPDSGEVGSFLFDGVDHRTQGTRISPVFNDLVDLFRWMGKDWKESVRLLGTQHYIRRPPQ